MKVLLSNGDTQEISINSCVTGKIFKEVTITPSDLIDPKHKEWLMNSILPRICNSK